jgi:NAD(P)-dependent dehydrogenase (short-subunit alcohol dehydrogenase family)
LPERGASPIIVTKEGRSYANALRVLAMTRTLAAEWARHNIRMNILMLGPTEETGAIGQLFSSEKAHEKVLQGVPLKRLARWQEVADAAAYLVSDYAAYVNGENLIIDGGGG